MRKITSLVALTFITFSCTETNTADKKNFDSLTNSIGKKFTPTRDTSSLTIFKTHFMLSLQGQKREIQTQKQLTYMLENDYNRQDSLYVFIEDTFTARIEEAMKSIHNLKIDKYRIIVTKDYFKFP